MLIALKRCSSGVNLRVSEGSGSKLKSPSSEFPAQGFVGPSVQIVLKKAWLAP